MKGAMTFESVPERSGILDALGVLPGVAPWAQIAVLVVIALLLLWRLWRARPPAVPLEAGPGASPLGHDALAMHGLRGGRLYPGRAGAEGVQAGVSGGGAVRVRGRAAEGAHRMPDLSPRAP